MVLADNPLKAPLPYYGGKFRQANWIAERTVMRGGYIEPFAGLASVLLARSQAKLELLNDRSDLVVTWWRMVRDQRHNLQEMLRWTPRSRSERDLALRKAEDPDSSDLDKAWAFTVLATQSMAGNLVSAGAWKHWYTPKAGNKQYSGDNLNLIAERIRNVLLDNRDACDILTATQTREDLMIYCDPPYHNANTSAYRQTSVDRQLFFDLLVKQPGSVAVSGYLEDWPDLDDAGWHRHDRPLRIMTAPTSNNQKVRTESLWTNYVR